MLNYDISERDGKTKTLYLFENIKQDIRSGVLKAQERLPSKRELAEHLAVSTITVENAYAMLEDEGYIYSKPRSGFYVCDLNLEALQPEIRSDQKGRENNAPHEIKYLPEEEAQDSQRIQPAGMARYVRKVLSEKPEVMYMRPPHFGCAVLRNAIAEHLRHYRGMEVMPSHIIIGSGAEYLYGLNVQLLGRNVTFGIETPSYEKIELVYRANGARLEYLIMGEDGIRSDSLQNTKAKVIHVSPYHSYPTGVTATAEKRYEYLAWAEKNKGYIIEDDFDSEFSFYRKPIEPLFSMDNNQRVIYMNTFSKSISPAIRVAYMILPDTLLELYSSHLSFYSCPVPVLDQYVLAAFIREGAFERHLGRLRHMPLRDY